jgi:hypothetical protein
MYGGSWIFMGLYILFGSQVTCGPTTRNFFGDYRNKSLFPCVLYCGKKQERSMAREQAGLTSIF